jgi:multiple sugar transport system substrate-binding protein
MGWWGNDDRAARTLQVIALFEAAYPEITVSGEPNGGAGDHFQILDTQLAANNAPDLIQFGGNWPDYEQYLEPFNGYLGKQQDDDRGGGGRAPEGQHDLGRTDGLRQGA